MLYAGGDGTTRDIVEALGRLGEEAATTPLIGVPGGVFSMIVWAVIVMGHRSRVTAMIRVPTFMVMALA